MLLDFSNNGVIEDNLIQIYQLLLKGIAFNECIFLKQGFN